MTPSLIISVIAILIGMAIAWNEFGGKDDADARRRKDRRGRG